MFIINDIIMIRDRCLPHWDSPSPITKNCPKKVDSNIDFTFTIEFLCGRENVLVN